MQSDMALEGSLPSTVGRASTDAHGSCELCSWRASHVLTRQRRKTFAGSCWIPIAEAARQPSGCHYHPFPKGEDLNSLLCKRRAGEDFKKLFIPSITPFPNGVRGSQ